MESKVKRLKFACYTGNLSMSVVSNLSPILFQTFRELYSVSYSLLGFLVLINFVTQLFIDFVFSFFSHKFDIAKVVKITPLITVSGLVIYALWPFVFPNSVYVGLVIGTMVFSSACGLCEVLLSPVIAALPSKDPDREMSRLHSVYAWGVVFVVIFSTVFLFVFGNKNWQYLALFFIIIPLCSAVLFAGAEVPVIKTPEKVSGALRLFGNKTLWFCVAAIFLGGAAECTMAQWCSGYLEAAFNIPKILGDVFGVALFSFMLGVGRTLYSKFGKNIERVLFFGAVGAFICYFTAAVSSSAVLGLFACALTGFFVSMLWPGNLVVASSRFVSGGVFIYAMMAAGGDLGASVAPQLVGIITDAAMPLEAVKVFASKLDITPEQLSIKMGMAVGAFFSLAAIFLYSRFLKTQNKPKNI